MAFIRRDNIVLHYQWLNHKRPKTLVVINSLGTNFMIWGDMVPLVRHEFNILLFDKRGHGLSSTQEGAVTIDDFADDVIFLMDQLGIKKTDVLGLSIGGLITYSLASRYPDRFKHLIFSNTGAKIGTSDGWNERISSIQEKGITSITKSIVERWLSDSYRKDHPADAEGYVNMLNQNSTLGYIQACEAIRQADFNPDLKKIKHRSMFIGGSKDVGTPAEFVREQARNLGAERVEIIEGIGHLPCIERPQVVADLILEFCKDEIDTSLHDKGMHTRRAVLGDAHVDLATVNTTEFDRAFQEYIVKSAWGAIWSRPHLTKRERSMITIALLAALGHQEELKMHIKASQNTNTSEADVKEVLLHTGVYAGVPVTNGAMKIAKQIFAELERKKDE